MLAFLSGPIAIYSLLALYSLSTAAFVAALGHAAAKSHAIERLQSWSRRLLLATVLLNVLIVASRWMIGGGAPLRSLDGTLLFFSACVTILALVLARRFVLPFASGIAALGLCYVAMAQRVELGDFPPALQSGWFVPHVLSCVIAYAALFLSFVLACLSLFPRQFRHLFRHERTSLRATKLREQAHKTAYFGIAALSFGLILGAIWAKTVWGDYWPSSPKQSWALVSWLSYAVYFQLRGIPGWLGRRSMWVLVGAFGTLVFTYLGMGLLPSSLDSIHAYQ